MKLIMFLMLSGGILFSTPLFAQSDRQPGLVVVLKPGYTMIDSMTLQECLRGFVESEIATASFVSAVEDGKKVIWKTKIKWFAIGLGTGTLVSLTYMIGK